MTPEELKERIPESEFVFIASRSGGPGGQNVNKVNTKSERTQLGNKKKAVERLLNILASGLEEKPERKPTHPSESSGKERLDGKKLRGRIKKLRSNGIDPSAD